MISSNVRPQEELLRKIGGRLQLFPGTVPVSVSRDKDCAPRYGRGRSPLYCVGNGHERGLMYSLFVELQDFSFSLSRFVSVCLFAGGRLFPRIFVCCWPLPGSYCLWW